MSSKSVRRSTHISFTTTKGGETETTSSSKDVTADSGSVEDSGFAQPASPLSPTCFTRQQEKQQLQHLNDRLAQYIERVRQLETENQRLSLSIRNTEEIVTRERNNIKSAFEAELSDARRLLDETAKDKAKLQIDAGKFKALVEELQARNARLERELRESETRRLFIESQVQDLQGRLNTADSQKKHWEGEARKLKGDNDNLRKQLESAQKQLEEETLLRVDAENRMQSLREELAFNKQLYEQELEETRKKRQVEITELNQELEDEYKQKLQDALNEMREQLDSQIRINRKEIADMYESKMQDMRDMADSNRDTAATARDEVKRIRSQLTAVETDRSQYETKINSMDKKIKQLESQLRDQQEDFYNRMASREEEISRLQAEIAQMMQEYQDLMDMKIQLDVEIEAYRRLIEGEEARLNLSPTPPPGGQSAQRSERRGIKRRRIYHERETEMFQSYVTNSDCQGDVEVYDHDIEGMYVKLLNKLDKDIPIGGWVIKRTAGGNEVTYKFHSKLVMKPQKQVTVWSSNANVTHNPPGDLLMKNQQWPVGDTIRTVLINADDKEIAWRESVRNTSSKRMSFRSADPADYGIEIADGDQRCSVM
ncbi:unnamed protein product [Soboliphyme baturini]|uniref:Lamin n=1 Tax=Soboliphyme baturini TaxID=241478 RepID=A0A183IN10_9BILA|nr:unnamed protein product [Soboliphyme baturini]